MIPFEMPIGDLEAMDREALEALLAELQEQRRRMDAQAPRTMSGEAFEAWAEAHEALEDQIDDVMEALEALY